MGWPVFMPLSAEAMEPVEPIPLCEGCDAPSDPSIIDHDGCDLCRKCAGQPTTPKQDGSHE